MRSQRFGIEIEMTGITRAKAAQIIAGHFGTTANHVGGVYDAYTVRSNDGRQWKLVSDASIHCETSRGRTDKKQSKIKRLNISTPKLMKAPSF